LVSVVDADDVRRIATSLPHTVEIDSDGFDFGVGTRGFVWSYPEHARGQRRVIRTDIAVLYVGDEAEKQALLLERAGGVPQAPGELKATSADSGLSNRTRCAVRSSVTIRGY
jgi:hypothetical protein